MQLKLSGGLEPGISWDVLIRSHLIDAAVSIPIVLQIKPSDTRVQVYAGYKRCLLIARLTKTASRRLPGVDATAA